MTPEHEKEYTHALEQARDGEPELAAPVLENLLKAYPDDQRLAGDYVVILNWAGKDKEALDNFSRVDADTAPAYVINAAAKSARNLLIFDRAVTLYRQSHDHHVEDLPAVTGLILSLTDAGKPDEALKTAESALEKHGRSVDLLFAKAYAHEARKESVKALMLYEEILNISPGDPSAMRMKILTLSALGAPGLALSMADKFPSSLKENDWRKLRGDMAAAEIRWGELTQPPEVSRFHETDAAIARLEENLKALLADGLSPTSPHALRERYDRIIALRDRVRMKDVAEEYENFLKEGVTPPYYVTIAAGDAYLYLEKAGRAIELYKQALKDDPDNYNIRMSIFYSYVELDDFDNAFKWIDALAAKEPEWRKRGRPPVYGENGRKLRADIAAAQGRAFADDLAEAQKRLEPMMRRSPFNHEIRQSLAYTYLWRGWARKAKEEFEMILPVEPIYLDARLGMASAHLDLREYREMEEAIKPLADMYPENKRVQQLARNWKLHNMRLFTADVGFGSGAREEPNTRDMKVDTYLFSQPINFNYRAFLHGFYEEADVENETSSYQREGAGLEYTSTSARVRGELDHNKDSDAKTDFAGLAEWYANDYLTMSASFDTFSLDVPLRARLHGIGGRSAGASASWRSSDIMSASAGYQWIGFTDGNTRESANASWRRRVINGPFFKLPLILEAYASRNSLRDRPYFNPEEDLSVSATLDNRWLVWRSYTWSFAHNLAFMAGGYWQKGFGWKEIGFVRYEHDWNLGDTVKLLYGITWNRRVYDGVPQDNGRLYLEFRWRF